MLRRWCKEKHKSRRCETTEKTAQSGGDGWPRGCGQALGGGGRDLIKWKRCDGGGFRLSCRAGKKMRDLGIGGGDSALQFGQVQAAGGFGCDFGCEGGYFGKETARARAASRKGAVAFLRGTASGDERRARISGEEVVGRGVAGGGCRSIAATVLCCIKLRGEPCGVCIGCPRAQGIEGLEMEAGERVGDQRGAGGGGIGHGDFENVTVRQGADGDLVRK